MKKIKLAIAALVIAAGTFGVFAFSKVDKKEPVKEEMQTFLYGNTGGGIYAKIVGTPNPNGCLTQDDNPCQYTATEDVESFELGVDEPMGATPVDPNSNFLYTP